MSVRRFHRRMTPCLRRILAGSRSFASSTRSLPDDNLQLTDFVRRETTKTDVSPTSSYEFHASRSDLNEAPDEPEAPRKFYLETYGCQMNVSDSEIVHSILSKAGMERAANIEDANILLVNTCSIREKAEERVWNRLYEFRAMDRRDRGGRVVGVLGCMAERLKERLLERDQLVDVVVGPDAYRDLPRLLSKAQDGSSAVNTLLSLEETYADIAPVRPAANQVSAYASIMRGCNNMCSYCIVPRTRGRERSRHVDSIVDEVRRLSDEGFKEVTLLGQNVNSYNDITGVPKGVYSLEDINLSNSGFSQKCKLSRIGVRFPELLDRVSLVDPEMRIRFTSPHPKDFPLELIRLISERPNICNQLHIPAQSGSSRVLELMRRDYTRESYLELIDTVKATLPNVALTSDFIAGFCGERKEDHEQTLDLIRKVGYLNAFMFAYSQREKTPAHRSLEDDVPHDVKHTRLREMVETFNAVARNISQKNIGRMELVLVQGPSKRSPAQLSGRADSNKKVVFEKQTVPGSLSSAGPSNGLVELVPGDYVAVRIEEATQASLRGSPVARTTLTEFHAVYGDQKARPAYLQDLAAC